MKKSGFSHLERQTVGTPHVTGSSFFFKEIICYMTDLSTKITQNRKSSKNKGTNDRTDKCSVQYLSHSSLFLCFFSQNGKSYFFEGLKYSFPCHFKCTHPRDLFFREQKRRTRNKTYPLELSPPELIDWKRRRFITITSLNRSITQHIIEV